MVYTASHFIGLISHSHVMRDRGVDCQGWAIKNHRKGGCTITVVVVCIGVPALTMLR